MSKPAHNATTIRAATDNVEAEIADLKDKLRNAKERLKQLQTNHPRPPGPNFLQNADLSSRSQHSLLLLSDSALPLGSFAYSSGLESYIAHHRPLPPPHTTLSSFHRFLCLSIESVTFSNVPYLLAVFRQPTRLAVLDNDFDASTPCTVARRASVAQGKALLSVWEKALRYSIGPEQSGSKDSSHGSESGAGESLVSFSRDLKISVLGSNAGYSRNNKSDDDVDDGIAPLNGHFAPLWGAVCSALGLEIHQAGYLFLFSHVKAVLSAAIRAGVMGPYQAQGMLAGQALQKTIKTCLERVWDVDPDDAGQVVPSMDLWVGRHELLYSRIFNS